MSITYPRVETNGELERAEREFLHTNGAGAFSMSTLALLHTRRQHGLLVAALEPPLKRYVVLSQADTIVTTAKRSYRLGSYQFPSIAPTPGYRYLRSFHQDPLPRFTYRLGKADFELTLALVRGENALVLCYRWLGRRPVRVSIKPLLAMRPLDEVTREHGGMLQRVSIKSGGVEIQPVASLPPLIIRHGGMFMGSPDWWRRFEYADDQDSGLPYQEDLWTPGTMELLLEPGQFHYVTMALDRLPSASGAECLAATRDYLLGLDPGEEQADAVRWLSVAADSFRVDQTPRPGVIAGYPTLAMVTRDTLVSIPGLYFATGRLADAERVLREVIGNRARGLLCQGTREDGSGIAELTADGSLWLFEVTRLFAQKTSISAPFVREELFPVLLEIYRRIADGSGHLLWQGLEGLLVNSSEHLALTWMDSRSQNEFLVPRQGAAVELQALWSAALRTLSVLAAEYGQVELAARLNQERARLIEAFKAKFWCAATNYPYDCLSARGEEPFADSAIRPNAVVALAVEPDLFDSWQAIRIVEFARERLLTSRGLRTLEAEHPAYVGHFEATVEERHTAYHRGAAWPFLLGSYARAALRLRPNDFELQVDLRHLLQSAMADGPVLGQVAQLASGDAPHHAGGCPAQAWSIAEILRTLVLDLGL